MNPATQRSKSTFLKRAVSNNSDRNTFSFEFNISSGMMIDFLLFLCFSSFFSLPFHLNSEHFSQMAAVSHLAAAVYTEKTIDIMNNALQK